MGCNMTFLVMWYHGTRCWHHMMLMASLMAPLHCLGPNIINMQYDFLVMWYQWHQCLLMPMALSMVPLHYIGQNDQSQVLHDIFGQVMPLASNHANGIMNDTIAFLRSRQSNCSATWLFFMGCKWAPALALCDVYGIVNGTIALLWSR